MSTGRDSLLQTTLARLSRGAVPMDGIYWLDPKARKPVTTRERPELPDEAPVSTRWWRLIARIGRPA
jgi:hypothetical protein